MTTSIWRLVVCGVDFRSASLQQREPLQIGRDELARAHATLAEMPDVREAIVVSTCNRVEFYLVHARQSDSLDTVAAFYQALRGHDIRPQIDSFYKFKGRHVAEHIFRVAAGIDSMVLGENQIMGQLKEAYGSACAVKTTGKMTHRLFHQAFRVGKLVRTDTEMGRGACSVSSAAMDLLKSRIAGIDKPQVLFVGINRMIQLAANNLGRRHRERFVFANRTLSKAEKLAAKYQAASCSLDELPMQLRQADVVITCTGSEHPIITQNMLETAVDSNGTRPLVIVDMAVPRDVEYVLGLDDRVEIHDLNHIEKFVASQQERRHAAIPQAEIIIERRLAEFVYWYDHVLNEPIYNGMSDAFEITRQEEMDQVLSEIPEEYRLAVQQASKRLTGRLMTLKVHSNETNRETE